MSACAKSRQPELARYLGVDGGGSKTAFALIDDAGQVLARATAPTSYYFNDGFDVVERVLAQGVTDICGQAGIETSDIDAAFFGIPGYGEASGDIEQLDAVPMRVLGHDRYSCNNDMVCGWAGSLAGEDGINVISGTGSMTYGERQGTGHRVGGWGELFGDEGSAYWVAAQGLNAFSRMSDGRLARGPLYELMRARLEIASDLDAVSLVIEKWGGNRTSIAALSTTVCEAARQNDETCAAHPGARRRRAGDDHRNHPRSGRFRRRRAGAGVLLGWNVLRRGLPRAVSCCPATAARQVRPAHPVARSGGGRGHLRRQAQRPSAEPAVPCTNSPRPDHDPKR